MRYHRILVALDTSFLQPAVYEQALVEAKLHAAEVKLFHSVEAEINPLGNSTISPVGTPLESGYLLHLLWITSWQGKPGTHKLRNPNYGCKNFA